MSLPFGIERMLSLRHKGGGRLIYPRFSQQIVAAFPAGMTPLAYTVGINKSDYVNVLYKVEFGRTMVPNAFSADIVDEGNQIFSGVVTGSIINSPIDTFLPVLQLKPTQISIVNVSGIVQYYELNTWYLGVSSPEDWKIIMKKLEMEVEVEDGE